MENQTDLLNCPPTDRAVLALTHLRMKWETSEDREITDDMIYSTAQAWSLSEDEIGSLSSFLCEFVMAMREEADMSDDGFDN